MENRSFNNALNNLDLSLDNNDSVSKKKKSPKWIKLLVLVAILMFGSIAGIFTWFNYQLSPVNSSDSTLKQFNIESGTLPNQIATQLEEDGLIRSSRVFVLYARLTGSLNKLQAGSYRLSPNESAKDILNHLKEGNVDTFTIQFLPGATLSQNIEVLKKAGYSESEINAALKSDYSEFSDLFEGKPDSADLEGYIYGETYTLNSGATVEDIISESLKHMEDKVDEYNLKEGFKKQGLSLYEGITLASIIQREVSSQDPSEMSNDQRQVAQIFLLRLKKGMSLGSDVTYQYIADKLGVERDVNLDNPYNTRKYTGLPPGPISAPGLGALRSVANPASGDYLYFLSGDDDVTYFARTEEEHNANIKNHCAKKCEII